MNSVNLGWATFDASMNSFIGNNITNRGRGLGLNVNSDNNTISGNIVTAPEWVIALHACRYNNVTENYIADGQIGIYLPDSSHNRIYHNQIVNNIQQASLQGFPSHTNLWDDGYPSGGNYWSGYGGVDLYSGSYQNETDNDGIGDTPVLLDGNNTDRYPLMKPWFSLVGDVNRDGEVVMKDIDYAARRFTCLPGDQLWDSAVDINHDGKIDMKDIGTVARHFGARADNLSEKT
jgi:parallel beta-helix repeat protein